MKKLMGLLLALNAGMAMAQEPALAPAPEPAAPANVPGQQARAWLDLQASGAQAATELRPVPGEVAAQVYQRYVNSFKTAIPESMQRESFVGKGGSQ